MKSKLCSDVAPGNPIVPAPLIVCQVDHNSTMPDYEINFILISKP